MLRWFDRSALRSCICSAALLALMLASTPLAGQAVLLTLGSFSCVPVPPRTMVSLPLTVKVSPSASTSIASLQGRLAWSAAQLTLDSVRASGSSGWTVLTNLDSVAQDRASVVAYRTTALAASAPIAVLYFTEAIGAPWGHTGVVHGQPSRDREWTKCTGPSADAADGRVRGAKPEVGRRQRRRCGQGRSPRLYGPSTIDC